MWPLKFYLNVFGKPQHIISTHMDELLKIPGGGGERATRLLSFDSYKTKISINVRGFNRVAGC